MVVTMINDVLRKRDSVNTERLDNLLGENNKLKAGSNVSGLSKFSFGEIFGEIFGVK